MILLYCVGLIVGVFGLVKITNKLIHLIKIIGHRLGLPTFVVSSIFLAAATSFPELFVGISSSIRGLSELSLGNILGACLTDISLVLGLAIVISGGVITKQKALQKDLFEVGLIALTPYLLLIDGRLTRLDGVMLLVIYVVYTFLMIEKEKAVYRLPDNVNHHHNRSTKSLVFGFLGFLGFLGIMAQAVVFSAQGLADILGVSAFLFGLLLLSIGTTMPELVVEIQSAHNREPGIFFGNILGSLAINSSLILGILILINPINLGAENNFLSPGMLVLLVFILLLVFIKSKYKLERKEGIVVLGIYLLFLFLEMV
jgi:cation:H+ antiporter